MSEFTHQNSCRWEKTTNAECEYRDTHHYCPHPEHECDCTTAKQLRVFSPEDLVYAAGARCQCGAGLAYPKGLYEKPEAKDNPAYSHWNCSYLLVNDVKMRVRTEGHVMDAGTIEEENGTIHDGPRSFTFFEIKSENQPSANGHTTRPRK